MYIIGNKLYTDAGFYLKTNNVISYVINSNESNVQEIKSTVDDMWTNGTFIFWSEDKLAQRVLKNGTYGDYKKAIIQKKYNNDDQIAIMLNKDNGDEIDKLAYQKMQEWREWASIVAKKIIKILDKNLSVN